MSMTIQARRSTWMSRNPEITSPPVTGGRFVGRAQGQKSRTATPGAGHSPDRDVIADHAFVHTVIETARALADSVHEAGMTARPRPLSTMGRIDPASLSTTPRPIRWNSGKPSSRSKLAIACDNEGSRRHAAGRLHGIGSRVLSRSSRLRSPRRRRRPGHHRRRTTRPSDSARQAPGAVAIRAAPTPVITVVGRNDLEPTDETHQSP